MRYRKLGNTGLEVSEIGLGAEWLERHNQEEVTAVIRRCEEQGINILDCWMSNPEVRSKIGCAIQGRREKWIIQGTSVPPGRRASTSAPGSCPWCGRLSRTCSPGCRRTTSTWG